MTTSHDGVRLATHRTGAEPRLVLVHANGFCKETWGPFVDELGAPDHLGFDQRGHGDSSRPPFPIDWWDLGRDVLSVIDDTPMPAPLTGIGHSSGGAALTMAEILRPGTFDRLILIEPIIVPPPYERHDDHPLALLTERRRPSFESAEAAFGAYRTKPPFNTWDPRALKAYVEHGFEARDGEWALKCDPAVEAEVYRTAFEHGVWDLLDEVGCEVVLVFGTESQAESAPDAQALVGRFARARLVVMEGVGHLIPMERPEALAAVVAAAI